ncbi:hypothetical protein GCM10011380_15500 [Sphingomonas metalli]|uniref:HTH merR-type domain-containing protein n=1 Tax=Sphingomonas metalli TaxID=1779358 RepID=A0A916WT09_9SPHN|nr:helix-turn-helix domain-containing protein [Sphingomonas metalli]GGB26835.1 hypothetical protein GCM10011380_15500 [Sphingomonas metalli]
MLTEIVHDFDEKAASRILGIAPRTLRRWRMAGLVSHYRTPTGRIRYTTDDLLALQRAGRTPLASKMAANGRTCPQMAACVPVTPTDDKARQVA